MRAAQTPFIEGLVAEEIRRFVAEAIAKGDMISTSECVAKINAVYPNCGISKRSDRGRGHDGRSSGWRRGRDRRERPRVDQGVRLDR